MLNWSNGQNCWNAEKILIFIKLKEFELTRKCQMTVVLDLVCLRSTAYGCFLVFSIIVFCFANLLHYVYFVYGDPQKDKGTWNGVFVGDKQQHGFMKNKSTVTAGLMLQSLITRAVEDDSCQHWSQLSIRHCQLNCSITTIILPFCVFIEL